MLARRPTHGVRSLALLVLPVILGAGCASAGQSWRAGPAGIPVERELRAQMTAGQYDAAWQALKKKQVAPADALLRHLYKGVVGLHAGQLDEGARSMDRAWSIVYDRWTKRISDGAAALATGDGALPYYPGPAERMFIPYYGGLTWLARNERASAAVEARRLSALLASDQGPQPPDDFRGVLRYVAGVMYEVAGERNDADVSFRNANVLLDGALPGDTIPPDTLHGDVVVLIEDGFVDRPEPAALEFWLREDELKALDGDDYDRRTETMTRIHARRHDRRDWAAEHYRSVSLRWPTMEGVNLLRSTSTLGARALRVGADVADVGGAEPGRLEARTVSMSVSDAVRADFERAQPARLARAVARAALREVTLDGAGRAFEAAGEIAAGDDGTKSKKPDNIPEKKKNGEDEKDDEGAGKGWKIAGAVIVGLALLFIHAGSQVLDQPDLRAWQLLPDRVTVARMRLPVGDYPVEVTRDGEAFSLGTVTVRPGSVTVLTHRWWPDDRRVAGASDRGVRPTDAR